jgi:hypothetical protein
LSLPAPPGRRTHRAAGLPGAWLALALALHPAPARASTEEFADFDVVRTEEDDESALDHLLLRPPSEWRDEWERAPQAFRTAQGCFTSGQWYVGNELRLGAPMGRRARFGLRLEQLESDVTTYENLDLWFLFPQRAGTLGVMFRPNYDKSRQDFAVQWEFGADSTADQLRLTYGFEDLFNNLWVWRQTRVGESGSPYERHPWEPAFKAALRRATWRLETEGRWLTLSRRRLHLDTDDADGRVHTLWGAWGTLALEARVAGVTWSLQGENRQARSTDQPVDDPEAGSGRSSRSLWQAEAGARRRLGARLVAEGRWIYADRRQSLRPPLGDLAFHGFDRVLQLETRWLARRDLTVRLGGLYDRAGVTATGTSPGHPWTDRNESRAYIGLIARCGRVSLSGVEGIELDPERYQVWHHHDKAFLLLQTTF